MFVTCLIPALDGVEVSVITVEIALFLFAEVKPNMSFTVSGVICVKIAGDVSLVIMPLTSAVVVSPIEIEVPAALVALVFRTVKASIVKALVVCSVITEYMF